MNFHIIFIITALTASVVRACTHTPGADSHDQAARKSDSELLDATCGRSPVDEGYAGPVYTCTPAQRLRHCEHVAKFKSGELSVVSAEEEATRLADLMKAHADFESAQKSPARRGVVYSARTLVGRYSDNLSLSVCVSLGQGATTADYSTFTIYLDFAVGAWLGALSSAHTTPTLSVGAECPARLQLLLSSATDAGCDNAYACAPWPLYMPYTNTIFVALGAPGQKAYWFNWASVLAHELGHSMGLAHTDTANSCSLWTTRWLGAVQASPDDGKSIMVSNLANLGARAPSTFDVAALMYLYELTCGTYVKLFQACVNQQQAVYEIDCPV